MPTKKLSERDFTRVEDHVIKNAPPGLSEADFDAYYKPALDAALGTAEAPPSNQRGWEKSATDWIDSREAAPGFGWLNSLAKPLMKGAVQTAAHPIDNAPMIAGALASGGAALATGGLSLPAQGLIGAGAAAMGGFGGSLLRSSQTERGPNDPGGAGLGGTLMDATTNGLTQGAIEGVPHLLAGGARMLAPVAKSAGLNLYNRALKPSIELLKEQGGPTWAGALADKAKDFASFGIEKRIKPTQMGAHNTQQLIDGLDASRQPLIDAHAAANPNFHNAEDVWDQARPHMERTQREYRNQTIPQDDIAMLDAQTQKLMESPELTEMVTVKHNVTKKVDTGLLDKNGKKVFRDVVEEVSEQKRVPKRLDSRNLHDIKVNTNKKVSRDWGDRKGPDVEIEKAAAVAEDEMLNAAIPELEPINHQMRQAIALRQALQGTLARDQMSNAGVPGAYLAFAHPGLAAAQAVVKSAPVQTRMLGEAGIAASDISKWMAKREASGATAGVVRGGALTLGNQPKTDQDRINDLFAEWQAQDNAKRSAR